MTIAVSDWHELKIKITAKRYRLVVFKGISRQKKKRAIRSEEESG
jgi:hypothetical protein